MLRWGPSILINGNALLLAEVQQSSRGWYDTERVQKGGHKAHAYEHSVYRTLEAVARKAYRVGPMILQEIARSGKQLWIVPWRGSKPGAKANARGLLHAPNRAYDEAKNQCATDPVAPRWIVGDTLQFTPGVYRAPDNTAHWNHGNKYVSPDEVLAHELFHEVRGLGGWLCPSKSGDHYGKDEEFYAILVENLYRSERDRPIRASPGNIFRTLNMDGTEFYLRYTGQIDRLCDQMPDLMGHLAGIDCNFNPLKERERYEPGR